MAITFALKIERFAQPEQPLVRTGRHQSAMELRVSVGPVIIHHFAVLCAAFRDATEFVIGGDDCGFPFYVAQTDGLRQAHFLKRNARFGQIGQFLAGNRRDGKALLRFHPDHAVCGQTRQGFPRRAKVDVVAGTHVVDLDLRGRRQLTGKNGFLQAVIDLVGFGRLAHVTAPSPT